MSIGKSLFKNIYKLHVYAGIFVAVHFAIFAVTGLMLLFQDEIQSENRVGEEAPKKNIEQIAQGYAAAFDQLIKTYPNDRLLALFPDDENANVLNARLGIDGATRLRGSRRATMDLNTGLELKEKPAPAAGFFDWVLRLHRELLLGSNGKLYVGFVGLVYVFMLVSGFFIYGKFMKGRLFGELRRGRLPKLVDLHKFTGIVTFGWGLVVGLSGAFLAFNGILIRLFQMSSLRHLSQRYEGMSSANEVLAPFAKVIETALRAKADAVVSYMSFPDTEFGIPGHYLILLNGTDELTKRISQLAVIDSRTGALAEMIELPLYLKIVLLSEPLHFGNYGGWPLKILWAIFAVCALAVAMFGVTSFFMKRRNRMRETSPIVATMVRNSVSWAGTSVYRAPAVLLILSLVGLAGALFTSGIFAKICVALLAIPLVVLFFGRRKHV